MHAYVRTLYSNVLHSGRALLDVYVLPGVHSWTSMYSLACTPGRQCTPWRALLDVNVLPGVHSWTSMYSLACTPLLGRIKSGPHRTGAGAVCQIAKQNIAAVKTKEITCFLAFGWSVNVLHSGVHSWTSMYSLACTPGRHCTPWRALLDVNVLPGVHSWTSMYSLACTPGRRA
jgi:hypothetical protein